MTNEEFDRLVKQLETYAQQHPGQYKLRVGLLAFLGYAYIFLVLLGLVATLIGLVWLMIHSRRVNSAAIKLAIFSLALAFIILRSLWVSFPPPKGLELQRKQFPKLFAAIDELTQALKAPSFDRVLLVPEFNAAVVQVPRLGILGWQQNYLLLGLPLLQALSPEQFRAVIAHEIGHLSGNHSRFAAWIYRVRKTWGQIVTEIQNSQSSGTDALLTGFFKWYAPFFEAYSFVLARSNEYEADRLAAQLTGQEAIASALVNLEVKAPLEQSFWANLEKRCNTEPNPPNTCFHELGRSLKAEVELETAQQWLDRALAVKTDSTNTHPCLTERLAVLGYPVKDAATLLAPVTQSAAEAFLGKKTAQLSDRLSQDWQTAVNFHWKERYNYAQQISSTLETLEQKANRETLSAEEAWERARLTAELKNWQVAIPLLKNAIELEENHVNANYVLGKILLVEQQDESGIQHIERAIAKDPNLYLSGCKTIYQFLQQQGRQEEAEQYSDRANRHYHQLALAKQERSTFSPKDKFQPHGLPVETIRNLQQQLKRYPITDAYLVQKVVQHFPEFPLYLLVFKNKVPFWKPKGETDDTKIMKQMIDELTCPQETVILSYYNPANAAEPVCVAIEKQPGSSIYKSR